MDSLLLDPPGAYLRYLDLPGDDLSVVWLHGLGARPQRTLHRIPRTYLFGEHSLSDPETDRLAGQGIQVPVVPNAGYDMVNDNPAGVAERTAEALRVTAQGS